MQPWCCKFCCRKDSPGHIRDEELGSASEGESFEAQDACTTLQAGGGTELLQAPRPPAMQTPPRKTETKHMPAGGAKAAVEGMGGFFSDWAVFGSCLARDRKLDSSPVICLDNSLEDWKSCYEDPDGYSSCDEETLGEASSSAAQHEDWWDNANFSEISGFQGLSRPSKLLCTKVVRHPAAPGAQAPWLQGRADQLYREMGAKTAGGSGYLAVWLNIGAMSIVFLSELPEGGLGLFHRTDLLNDRVKLILNTVKVRVPIPTKGPRDADTVGAFFGSNCSAFAAKTAHGPDVAVLQVDLYAKWIMKLALQQGGFRLGNTIELILVDWPGKAIVSAIRLICTEEFIRLLS